MEKENKHNKDLGFQVPQDFFKNFEEDMMTQWNLEDKLGKETGFEVPDGYFETLEEQLLPVVDDKVRQLPKKSNVTTFLYPVLAIAAMLAIVLTLNSGNESVDIASVDTSVLEDYLIEESFLYDDATVDILFADNDILDNISLTESVDTDVLYDYLEDEMDLNEIITE
ncbi:hypothetical protein JCM19275_1125 [Nonlabens ulvanivorans]|uniref:Uncharacterized protein n=1 Tax=Nonlabens ulvanivorans TaxID=906888 RepID=A0A090WDQ0_NONUL|nr:hypothetical protein [Nonlabens ulvanivorans]WOI23177.1 hypothetical protein R1T42_01765 [Nonlabens ulvanivorans]GAL75086.1 hypothetical protein JCM19275_1125 [Nonlabens ulvanivorans]